MPRNGSGVYSLPAGSTFTPNTVIQSAVVNGINSDIATDLNTARPIVAGGTGATTAAGAAAALGVYPNTNPIAGFRNQLINGDFPVWSRNITQSTSGYGSDDRWINNNNGSTKVTSLQTHPLGQTNVPGNPIFFTRTVVTSVANAANFVAKTQRIESVSTFSGVTATVTFYAKADASKNIAFDLAQNFGTGGSPSAFIEGIGARLCALTTSWQKFTFTVAIPSISGKTLGTVGDYLGYRFWFDAGSNFSTQSSSLGQQSGTFDISHCSLVLGDATGEADPFSPRHIQQELALCQRYYHGSVVVGAQSPAANNMLVPWYLPVQMRVTPSLTVTAAGSASNASVVADVATNGKCGTFQIAATAAGAFVVNRVYGLDAEL